MPINVTGRSEDVGGDAPLPLFHMGYVSTQSRPMDGEEMLKLLESARSYNENHGVTGVLLHRERSFFQVLEGVEADVREIYARVAADPRHERLEILFEEPCEEREFADWRMGFVELDGVDVSELEGVSDFLTRDLEPRELFTRLTRARRLMLLFRQMS